MDLVAFVTKEGHTFLRSTLQETVPRSRQNARKKLFLLAAANLLVTKVLLAPKLPKLDIVHALFGSRTAKLQDDSSVLTADQLVKNLVSAQKPPVRLEQVKRKLTKLVLFQTGFVNELSQLSTEKQGYLQDFIRSISLKNVYFSEANKETGSLPVVFQQLEN